MRPLIKLFLSFAVLATLSACASVQTTQPGQVGVHREQYMLVSAQQIEQSSAKQYAKEKRQYAAKGKLNDDPTLTRRVRNIADRLIPQTVAFRSDALQWHWEVNVLDSNELNAYCMAGGKIAVYSGLIKTLNLSDDEIAAVMGHEMAHALREHVREKVSREMSQSLLISGLAAFTGMGDLGAKSLDQIAQLSLSLPYSRELETEADDIGLELMARAGYDPRAAISVWQKMMNHENGSPPQWLSTHPDPQNRIADIQAHLPQVMPLYEQTLKTAR
jgi:predicted Zn-dependent protease